MNSTLEIPTCQLDEQPSQTLILDLNDDCLLEIFGYLSIEELAIASDTCQHFQEIGRNAFKYEWKGKIIWLSTETVESKLESTAILRNFGSQLQNIHIDFDSQQNDYFFELVIKKCCSIELTEVAMTSGIISKEMVHRFKNKFTNLRNLRLENLTYNVFQLESFEEYFPGLDHLTFFGFPFENRNVQPFIRLNPQVKSLSLLYRNGVENVRNILEYADQHLTLLEQLEVEWMPESANEIEYQARLFKNLKRLKFFHFGSGIDMQYLTISNENVEELELEEGWCDDSVIDFICLYKKVKKLAIRYVDYPLDYKQLLKLNNHLPKLVEFEISSSCRNLNHEDIVHFILDSEELTKFTVKDNKIDDILRFMEYLRKRLDSAKWTVDCSIPNNEIVIRKLSKE